MQNFQSAFFSLPGNGTIQSFTITNLDSEKIAVRITLLTREAGVDGKEIRQPAGDLFSLYP